MSVFIDSNVFIAYFNTRDSLHEKAKTALERALGGAHGEIFSSDYVFDESVTVTAIKTGFDKAIELGNTLNSSEITLVPTSHAAFEKAWQIFKKTRKISFTDCAILAAMEENGIKKLLSFDDGFKKMEGIQLIQS